MTGGGGVAFKRSRLGWPAIVPFWSNLGRPSLNIPHDRYVWMEKPEPMILNDQKIGGHISLPVQIPLISKLDFDSLAGIWHPRYRSR